MKFCSYAKTIHLSALVSSLAVAGWTLPVLASPRLFYQFTGDSNDLQTCLARAEDAMERMGWSNIAVMNESVTGGSSNIRGTVFCQRDRHSYYRTIVMVAGEAPTTTSDMEEVRGFLVDAQIHSNGGRIPSKPVSVDMPVDVTPMDDEAFAQLLATLDSKAIHEQESFLIQPIAQNYFTAAQASRLVMAVSFPDEQLDIAARLYLRVVDLGNWFVVEEAVPFFYREDLRRRVSQLESARE